MVVARFRAKSMMPQCIVVYGGFRPQPYNFYFFVLFHLLYKLIFSCFRLNMTSYKIISILQTKLKKKYFKINFNFRK